VLIAALCVEALFRHRELLHGLVPLTLFSSLIYAFSCFSVALFFYVYFKATGLMPREFAGRW